MAACLWHFLIEADRAHHSADIVDGAGFGLFLLVQIQKVLVVEFMFLLLLLLHAGLV